MEVSAFKLPVQQLEQEIVKEESNYKHAIQLRKNYYTLREIRKKIRVLKDALLNAPNVVKTQSSLTKRKEKERFKIHSAICCVKVIARYFNQGDSPFLVSQATTLEGDIIFILQ